MKLPLLSVLGLAVLLGGGAGCGGDPPTADPSAAVVEMITDDTAGAITTAASDDLGPDEEPMLSDEEIETAAARSDEAQELEAATELASAANVPETAAILNGAATTAAATAKPRCRKRITVTFAVYTYLTSKLGDNGCWVAENTVNDPSFRDCHADGKIKHTSGDKWFYDDTNPRNDLGTERRVLRDCSAGAKRGYEYMAFRDGRWRIVTRPHTSAYFAELYTDDAHLDDLYYASGVFRGNPTLRANKAVYPMLNFAPYPDGRYSQHQIGVEILKVCKTIRNHGYLGLYEWHYPLPEGSPRLRTVAQALNACTRR